MHKTSRSEADNPNQRALARARRFLDDQGIEVTANIHREDAKRMMVGFSAQEEELARQMYVSRRVMKRRRSALRALAGGSLSENLPASKSAQERTEQMRILFAGINEGQSQFRSGENCEGWRWP